MDRLTKKRKLTYAVVEEFVEKEETYTAKQVELMLKMVVKALREEKVDKPDKKPDKKPFPSYIS